MIIMSSYKYITIILLSMYFNNYIVFLQLNKKLLYIYYKMYESIYDIDTYYTSIMINK